MNRCIKYVIDKEYVSVERFLIKKGYSKNNIVSLKKMPVNIVLNDEFVHITHKLKRGDVLIINISERDTSSQIPVSYESVDIIYEDADIIVLNKPSGMPTHPSRGHYMDSLAGRLMGYYERKNEKFIFRCSNRLDKDTSGVIPVSKNMVSAAVMSKKSADRQITRIYLAICHGHFGDKDQGVINADIIRPTDSSIKRDIVSEDDIIKRLSAENNMLLEQKRDDLKTDDNKDKCEKAITYYEVLDELFIDGYPVSFVKLKLESGRTHQIRVHMKSIGHPLAGDILYGGFIISDISHPALNSYYMSFEHPINAKILEFFSK